MAGRILVFLLVEAEFLADRQHPLVGLAGLFAP
jgi:hypothetical protein